MIQLMLNADPVEAGRIELDRLGIPVQVFDPNADSALDLPTQVIDAQTALPAFDAYRRKADDLGINEDRLREAIVAATFHNHDLFGLEHLGCRETDASQ